MSKKQQTISRERRKSLLRRLKAEVGPHMRDLRLAGLLSWIQFLMRLASFYVIARLIQTLYQGQEVTLWPFILFVLVASALGFGAAQLAKPLQGRASQYARNNLKRAFFDVFEQSNGEFDGRVSQSDIMTIASQGIDSLDTYFQHYLSISLRTYFNCATVMGLVVFIYPMGGLIFLLCLPLIPISIVAMQKRSKRIMNHYWATYMDVGNLFMDDLQGMNTLYSYGADERYEQTFVEKAEAFRQSTMELLSFQLQSVGYMDGVMYLGVGVSGFFASLALYHGQISLFSLVFFVLIASEFFAPIREMGYGMHLVMMNTKMADRIYGFLDSVAVREDKQGESSSVSSIDKITFEKVSFSYGEQMIFEDLSVQIKQGELFAIAGESGLGKSTLAKLVKKYLRPNKGEIYLGEKSLSDLSDKDVQSQVMMVSPESYLFNLSIYENLAMATDKSPQAILEWAREQNVLNFVADLPDGLETKVGENGNRLSPGQRQQVLCARALLANRAVYIFDEMTSSIDNESEQLILDLIQKTSRYALVLFISHKMRQVLQADRVLFMSGKGQAQVASPETLLEENEAFKNLVYTQRELEAILHD